MKSFLILFIFLGATELVASFYYLAANKIPQRTRSGIAINGLVMTIIAVWAVYLLATVKVAA